MSDFHAMLACVCYKGFLWHGLALKRKLSQNVQSVNTLIALVLDAGLLGFGQFVSKN
jgi:hypothetical protein